MPNSLESGTIVLILRRRGILQTVLEVMSSRVEKKHVQRISNVPLRSEEDHTSMDFYVTGES